MVVVAQESARKVLGRQLVVDHPGRRGKPQLARGASRHSLHALCEQFLTVVRLQECACARLSDRWAAAGGGLRVLCLPCVCRQVSVVKRVESVCLVNSIYRSIRLSHGAGACFGAPLTPQPKPRSSSDGSPQQSASEQDATYVVCLFWRALLSRRGRIQVECRWNT